jgi:signal transduction histidine kinase
VRLPEKQEIVGESRPSEDAGDASGRDAARPTGLLSGDDTTLAEQVARIVHELRSPLASAAQAVDHLERTGDQPPDPTVLGVARRQLDAGLRRVEQLLMLLRDDAGRGEIAPEPHRLRDLVLQVTEERHLTVPQPRLRVDVASSLWVTVDANAFVHVLENLVGNAVRHAPEDTAVTVVAQAADGEVLLRVIDEGPGIDPDIVDRAFEPFTRGAEGGAGLGLTIVRHVVAAHGGRVWVEVDPDSVGTHVVVALPDVDAPGGSREG